MINKTSHTSHGGISSEEQHGQNVRRLDHFRHGGVLLEKKWDVVQLQFLPKHTAFFNSPRPQYLTITPRRALISA